MLKDLNTKWEPYFKPTRRVHDSGFRCFECGYLQMSSFSKKIIKKIIIGTAVDHITNWRFSGEGVELDFDLLLDGYIRVFNINKKLYWRIIGGSDARITDNEKDAIPLYKKLDEFYEMEIIDSTNENSKFAQDNVVLAKMRRKNE